MGVVSENTGPVSPETSLLQTNQIAVLQNIWLELKVIKMILAQAYGFGDSDAALRNSLLVSDLTTLS